MLFKGILYICRMEIMESPFKSSVYMHMSWFPLHTVQYESLTCPKSYSFPVHKGLCKLDVMTNGHSHSNVRVSPYCWLFKATSDTWTLAGRAKIRGRENGQTWSKVWCKSRMSVVCLYTGKLHKCLMFWNSFRQAWKLEVTQSPGRHRWNAL